MPVEAGAGAAGHGGRGARGARSVQGPAATGRAAEGALPGHAHGARALPAAAAATASPPRPAARARAARPRASGEHAQCEAEGGGSPDGAGGAGKPRLWVRRAEFPAAVWEALSLFVIFPQSSIKKAGKAAF